MQALFSFEQATQEADLAAAIATRNAQDADRQAKAKARADREREEANAKISRRLAREAAYRAKHPPGHAQCGIRWYPAGSGWTHCHACGQPLQYTTDPNAPVRDCPGKR